MLVCYLLELLCDGDIPGVKRVYMRLEDTNFRANLHSISHRQAWQGSSHQVSGQFLMASVVQSLLQS